MHTHGYKAGILGRPAAARLGIPSVSTFHMGESPPWPVSLYAAADTWSSFLSRRIAVSDDIRRRLTFAARIVRNWVDIPPGVTSFPTAPKRIGFVGRLSHEMAPDLFCDLAARFVGDGYEWHVFGDGPMRAELEGRDVAGLTFHGMVTDMARYGPRSAFSSCRRAAKGCRWPPSRRSGRACRSSPPTPEMSRKWWLMVKVDG